MVAVHKNGRDTAALQDITDEVLDPCLGQRDHRRTPPHALDRIRAGQGVDVART
jgi:hypothetical protein